MIRVTVNMADGSKKPPPKYIGKPDKMIPGQVKSQNKGILQMPEVKRELARRVEGKGWQPGPDICLRC